MMEISFIAFGNDQLENAPDVVAGGEILCPHCLGTHELVAATSEQPGAPELLFYWCGGEHYLAAIEGKLIIGIEPFAKGEM